VVDAENSRRASSSIRNGLLPQLETCVLDLVLQPLEACIRANDDIDVRLGEQTTRLQAHEDVLKRVAAEEKKQHNNLGNKLLALRGKKPATKVEKKRKEARWGKREENTYHPPVV
jgi:hypothetical protein